MAAAWSVGEAAVDPDVVWAKMAAMAEGSHRDECLNVHWFETLEEAKAISEAWRRDYSETRPHMALKDVPPEEYARQSGAQNVEN